MRRLATVLVALTVTAALSACGNGGESEATITSAQWSQNQAIENFDAEPGETTDATELQRLADILTEHDLYGEDAAIGEECDGGRTTDLTYVTDSEDEHTIRLQGCDRGDAGDAIDDLVSEWRTSR